MKGICKGLAWRCKHAAHIQQFSTQSSYTVQESFDIICRVYSSMMFYDVLYISINSETFAQKPYA